MGNKNGKGTHVTKEGKTAKKVCGIIFTKRKKLVKKCVRKVQRVHQLKKQ